MLVLHMDCVAVGDEIPAQTSIDRLTQGPTCSLSETPRGTSDPRKSLTEAEVPAMLGSTHRWTLARGNTMVPYRWQVTEAIRGWIGALLDYFGGLAAREARALDGS